MFPCGFYVSYRWRNTYADNCFQREKKSCAAIDEALKNLLRKIGNFNVILWFIPFTLKEKISRIMQKLSSKMCFTLQNLCPRFPSCSRDFRAAHAQVPCHATAATRAQVVISARDRPKIADMNLWATEKKWDIWLYNYVLCALCDKLRNNIVIFSRLLFITCKNVVWYQVPVFFLD